MMDPHRKAPMPFPPAPPRLLAVTGLALLLALGACSSDDAPEPAAVAPSIVVQADEIPDGWDAGPHDPRNDDFTRIARSFDRCIGIEPTTFPADAVTAHSPDFSAESGARQVKSTVNLLDEKLARRAVRALDRPRSARCLTTILRSQLDEAELDEVTVRSVSTAPLRRADVGAEAGGEVAALRSTLELTADGVDFVVYVDNVVMAQGPWFGRLFVVGTTRPPDPELEHRVVAAVQGRMAEAARG
jgi:hypothetical protein